jgi:glycine cleavage system H protein
MEKGECRYTDTHEWVRREDGAGGAATVGISRHAAEQVSDIVFVELPEPGRKVRQGEPFGSIESVKAVFDLNAPLSGTVSEVNPAVAEDPEIVGRAPEGDGWLIKIEVSDPAEAEKLMDAARYEAFTRE